MVFFPPRISSRKPNKKAPIPANTFRMIANKNSFPVSNLN
jgi:hypothetical protein